MAVRTTSQAGDWSDTDTWGGSAAPVEGDTAVIGHAVTIDDAAPATITVGDDSATPAIDIQSGGQLNYLYTATVDHVLVCKGDLKLQTGGWLQIGTAANPIPSTRSFTIKLNYSGTLTTDKYKLLIAGGNLRTYGWVRSYDRTILKSNAAASQPNLVCNDNVGWVSGDIVVIAPTEDNDDLDHEEKTVQSVSGDTITLTSNLSVQHKGSTSGEDMRAEVVLLNRNVKIQAYNASYPTQIVHTAGTWQGNWTEVRDGSSFLYKHDTAGVTNDLRRCSFHRTTDTLYWCGNGTANNTIVRDCVFYHPGTPVSANTIHLGPDAEPTGDFRNNWVLGGQHALGLESMAGNWSGFHGAGCGGSIIVAYAPSTYRDYKMTGAGYWDDIVLHTTGACLFSGYGTPPNHAWVHLVASGWRILASTAFPRPPRGIDWWGPAVHVELDDIVIKGPDQAIQVIQDEHSFGSSPFHYPWGNDLLLKNVNFADVDIGIRINGTGAKVRVIGGTIDAAENVIDDYCGGNDVVLDRVTLSDAETVTFDTVASRAGTPTHGRIGFNRIDGDATKHKICTPCGEITSETSVRHTASGLAWRMDPNISISGYPGAKFETPHFKAAVKGSGTVTVKIWLRKDTDYNNAVSGGTANQPRLVLIGGIVPGITTDQIQAMTAGADTWEQRSVSGNPLGDGVIEFYVDCDGTNGYVYLDDVDIEVA